MKFEILSDGNLKLSVSDQERENLLWKSKTPDFNSDKFLRKMLEPLIRNSDLDWSNADQVEVFKDVPILALYGQTHVARTGEIGGIDCRMVRPKASQLWLENVLTAWAFITDQASDSVQARLLNTGSVVLKRCFQRLVYEA